MLQKPFYLDDLDSLRDKLARAARDGTTLGRAWDAVRRRAQSAPDDFPWFTPFVAVVTGEERDAEAARRMIRSYLFDAGCSTIRRRAAISLLVLFFSPRAVGPLFSMAQRARTMGPRRS